MHYLRIFYKNDYNAFKKMDIDDLRNSKHSIRAISYQKNESDHPENDAENEIKRILSYVKDCAKVRVPVHAVISGLPFEKGVLTKTRRVSKEELDDIVFTNTGFSLREFYEGHVSVYLKQELELSRAGFMAKKEEQRGRFWEMGMVMEPAIAIDDEQEALRKANKAEIIRIEKEAHDKLEKSMGMSISLEKLNKHFS